GLGDALVARLSDVIAHRAEQQEGQQRGFEQPEQGEEVQLAAQRAVGLGGGASSQAGVPEMARAEYRGGMARCFSLPREAGEGWGGGERRRRECIAVALLCR